MSPEGNHVLGILSIFPKRTEFWMSVTKNGGRAMDDTQPLGDSPNIAAADGAWEKGLHWMEE